MGKQLESKEFLIKNYNDGQGLISDMVVYREVCMERYKGKCKFETKSINGGILAIVEELEEEKNAQKETKTEKGEER